MLGENLYKKAFEAAAANTIWVAPNGADNLPGGNMGSIDQPYATIADAVAAITSTRKIVMILPGSYTLDDAIDITVNGTQLIGVGSGVEITGGSGEDYMFKTVFGATSGTKEVTFKNLTLNHDDDSTQVGIQLQNTGATAKVNCYIDQCEFGTDGGNSIDMDHVVSTQAIRLYVTNSTIEGPVNAVIANAGDRLRFSYCTLRGGLVTDGGAVAAEILLFCSLVLHAGVSGGASQQTVYAIGCASETDADPNVYAALDTSDLAGSHTETVLFPAS